MSTDDIRRRGLLANLAGRLQDLEYDALRVVDRVTARLELGRKRYGDLDLAKPRPWRRERNEELLDAIVYEVAGELAKDDAAREALHEQARAEMVGPCVPEERRREALQLIGPVSIMDAPSELKAKALDQMEQECRRLTVESDRGLVDADDDPGPHAHVYVGTDRGDECELCGRMRDQFADLRDEWDAPSRRADRTPSGLELEGPEYDFEGGAG